jgi:RND family efflux transporter MFP subunit
MNITKLIGRTLIGAAFLGLLPFAGADGNGIPDDAIIARTIPSHTAKPTFMEVGIVKQWLVKADDVVKKGQVLGTEDSDLEELQLRSLRIEADSTAAVEAAQAARDSSKLEFERKSKLGEDASGTEIQEAQLDYQQKEAELRDAKMKREKALADVDIQSGKIQKMQLLSPADGIVEQINIQEGEIVDPNKPDGAITLVTNDPLWVEVKVPSEQALKLKMGDAGLVAYQNDPENWLKAKIIYIDPLVDAASDKETVRLELNNDANKVSGLWVGVRFPPAGANAMGSN